jgi:hypothetical protein
VGRPAPAARDVVEAHRKRVVDVDRTAEAHAAVEAVIRAPLEQQADDLQEVLVPAHGDAVFGHAAEARHHARIERLGERREVLDRFERHAFAVRGDA